MPQETCIIYLRKSTDRPGRQEISLEEQQISCEALAKKNNYKVVDILEEKLSSKRKVSDLSLLISYGVVKKVA